MSVILTTRRVRRWLLLGCPNFLGACRRLGGLTTHGLIGSLLTGLTNSVTDSLSQTTFGYWCLLTLTDGLADSLGGGLWPRNGNHACGDQPTSKCWVDFAIHRGLD